MRDWFLYNYCKPVLSLLLSVCLVGNLRGQSCTVIPMAYTFLAVVVPIYAGNAGGPALGDSFAIKGANDALCIGTVSHNYTHIYCYALQPGSSKELVAFHNRLRVHLPSDQIIHHHN